MIIPLDVPASLHRTFKENYNAMTKQSDNLLLFAFDHKMEHLVHKNPLDIFSLAAQMQLGAFATNVGLIARYGQQFPQMNYVAKLNSKTNLVVDKNPVSRTLWNVDSVLELKENGKLPIRGIGYTIYLGSEQESIMLAEAAYHISQAHHHGLVALVWIYPRGKDISDEFDANLIASAAGVGVCLGADFVKVKTPHYTNPNDYAQTMKKIAECAGNTRVIFSGGEKIEPEILIKHISEQMATGVIAGGAIGRNIYEQEPTTACALMRALNALVYEKATEENALRMFEEYKKQA